MVINSASNKNNLLLHTKHYGTLNVLVCASTLLLILDYQLFFKVLPVANIYVLQEIICIFLAAEIKKEQ